MGLFTYANGCQFYVFPQLLTRGGGEDGGLWEERGQRFPPDRELALAVLEDAHHSKGVLADVVDTLQESADLVHDLVVDGVLVVVLVVAPPDGEALRVEPLKVLHNQAHRFSQLHSTRHAEELHCDSHLFNCQLKRHLDQTNMYTCKYTYES